MEEVTFYKCSICGTVYDNKDQAKFCEGKGQVPIDNYPQGLIIYVQQTNSFAVLTGYGESVYTGKHHMFASFLNLIPNEEPVEMHLYIIDITQVHKSSHMVSDDKFKLALKYCTQLNVKSFVWNGFKSSEFKLT